MKRVILEDKAYKEFIEWAERDFDIFKKVDTLLRDISRDPFKGLGKPEPLKHKYQGYWSRRITGEHRIIYKMENNAIVVVSLKGHYD